MMGFSLSLLFGGVPLCYLLPKDALLTLTKGSYGEAKRLFWENTKSSGNAGSGFFKRSVTKPSCIKLRLHTCQKIEENVARTQLNALTNTRI